MGLIRSTFLLKDDKIIKECIQSLEYLKLMVFGAQKSLAVQN